MKDFPMNILSNKVLWSPQEKFTQEEVTHTRRDSSRSQQDLHNIFSQAPLQDLDSARATQNRRKANLAAHFVRACAVEMHMDISQSHFYAKIDRKMVCPPNLAARFVRAVEMHMGISQEQFHARI